jgi:hypothetical protein
MKALFSGFILFLLTSICTALSSSKHANSLPSELWSPLVAQKFYKTASNVSATQYPQYTDRTVGHWVNFNVDYWTSGFLPVALYAMRKREELCPGLAPNPKVDWLKLGREWSRGLLSLEVKNSVGHDVGFISFPFAEEFAL